MPFAIIRPLLKTNDGKEINPTLNFCLNSDKKDGTYGVGLRFFVPAEYITNRWW